MNVVFFGLVFLSGRLPFCRPIPNVFLGVPNCILRDPSPKRSGMLGGIPIYGHSEEADILPAQTQETGIMV